MGLDLSDSLIQLKKIYRIVTTPKRWPSPKQLRYLGRFLTVREKKAVRILLAASGIGVLALIFSLSKTLLEEIPKPGGIYREAVVGSPQLINPLYAPANEVDLDISRLVFSGLLRYNAEGALLPDLAQEYSVNEQKTEYTFIVRDNLFWHATESGGQPVPITVEDVLFTFSAIQDPVYASPLRVAFQGVTISRIDAKTIRFVLEKPFAPFLDSLTVGILPQHQWANVEPRNARLSGLNAKPVGAGPFMFSQLTRTESGIVQSITLKRYASFHRGAPFMDEIQFHFYPSYELAVQAVRSGRVEGLHFVPKKFKDQVERKHITLRTLQLPQYTALLFNPKQAVLLKDKKIREALGLAVDKHALLQDILKGEGTVINSPILEGFIGYDPAFHENGADTERAGQLLEEAGFAVISPQEYAALRTETIKKELQELLDTEEPDEKTAEPQPANDAESSTTTQEAPEESDPFKEEVDARLAQEMPESQKIYRAKNNEPLRLTITTVSDNELSSVAQQVAGSWRNLGLQVTIRTVAARDLNTEVLRPRLYEVLLLGQIVGADPDPFAFWHSSQMEYPGLNLANFSNRTADALLEHARTTADDEVRAQKYHEFQEIIKKEFPAVFLYAPTYSYALSTAVQGVTVERILTPADRFNDIETWYLKTRKVWKKE